MQSRSAFTMVELIFIIIIVGILVTTALPRLAATREDARLSLIAHNTMTGAFEIASYAVTKGKTTPTLSEMSNGVSTLIDQGYATESGADVTIGTDDVIDCLHLKIENQGSYTETIVIENTGSGGSCDRLQSLIDASRFPIPLRGTKIKF